MKTTCWIIMVNFRTADLAINCLHSIAGQIEPLGRGQVLVVDNHSEDGSSEQISSAITQEKWSAWARVISMETNGGFAYGNNGGIRVALAEGLPEYLLLLNPDTLVRPGAISALVDFMDNHPRVGIAGSLLENPSGGVDCSAHRVHSPLSELDAGARLGILSKLLRRYVVSVTPSSEPHPCDWVSGASMIIRRRVIEDIGLMDEGYFLYFEEVDFCWRAKKVGWDVWFIPAARVMHLEGASTGICAIARRRAAYWYDSRRRFFIKHYGVRGLLLADSLWAIGRLFLLLRHRLGLGGKNLEADPKWFMWDLLWGDLRALFNRQTRLFRQESLE